MAGGNMVGKRRVCVTGAGGFIGSWLVKILLHKGFQVHATVREPSDEKNAHLTKLENAAENLHLFKATLLDYDALHAAIVGCEGVFHTASPVPSTTSPNPEVEVIRPAVEGTLNVLKACSASHVKRVVVVSSMAAVSMIPNWPNGKIMDEDYWSDKEFCKKIQSWYSISKTMAEEAAWKYAKQHGLDVVVICPGTVIGPMLQSSVNSSSSSIINLMKGNTETMEDKLRHYVDVRDLAAALLLIYEEQEARGRYICAPHAKKVSETVRTLKSIYPNYKYPTNFTDADPEGVLSSEKLKSLGWKPRALEETFKDAIECYKKAGILDEN